MRTSVTEEVTLELAILTVGKKGVWVLVCGEGHPGRSMCKGTEVWCTHNKRYFQSHFGT